MQINDKVVCIDDKPQWGTLEGYFSHPNGYVEKGKIYCVSDIFIDLVARHKGDIVGKKMLMVRLVGCPCVHTKTGEIYGFSSARFRRLGDIKQEKI